MPATVDAVDTNAPFLLQAFIAIAGFIAVVFVIVILLQNSAASTLPVDLPAFPSSTNTVQFTNRSTEAWSGVVYCTSAAAANVNQSTTAVPVNGSVFVPVPANIASMTIYGYVSSNNHVYVVSLLRIEGKLVTVYAGSASASNVSVSTGTTAATTFGTYANFNAPSLVASPGAVLNAIPLALEDASGNITLPHSAVTFPSHIELTEFSRTAGNFMLFSNGAAVANGSGHVLSNATTSALSIGTVPVNGYVYIVMGESMTQSNVVLYNYGGKALLVPVYGSDLAHMDLAVSVPLGAGLHEATATNPWEDHLKALIKRHVKEVKPATSAPTHVPKRSGVYIH